MLRKLTASTLASLAVPAVAAAGAFVTTPLLLRSLGEGDYGLWVLCASVAAYAGLLDLGMAGAAMRFLASTLGVEDGGRRVALILTFRRFYRLVGGILITAGTLLGVAGASAAEGESARDFLLVLGILVASGGVGFVLRVNVAILQAKLEYPVIALAGIVRTLAFIGIVLSLGSQIDLLRLAWVLAGLSVAEQVLIWVQARRHLPVRSEMKGVAPAPLRPLLAHAGKTVIAGLSAALRWRLDTQIIAGFVSLPAVAQYSLGVKLPQLFFDLLFSLFGSQLVAAFAQWRGQHPGVDAKDLIVLAMKCCAVVSLSGGCALFFLLPDFLERWLGPGFDDAKRVALVLLPFWAVAAIATPASLFLTAESRHGRIGLISLGCSVIHVAVALMLVSGHGVVGVAAAISIEFALLLVGFAWFVAPLVGFRPATFLWNLVLFPALRFIVLAGPVLYLLSGILVRPFYPQLITGGIVLGLAGLVLAVATVPSGGERRLIWSLLVSLGR